MEILQFLQWYLTIQHEDHSHTSNCNFLYFSFHLVDSYYLACSLKAQLCLHSAFKGRLEYNLPYSFFPSAEQSQFSQHLLIYHILQYPGHDTLPNLLYQPVGCFTPACGTFAARCIIGSRSRQVLLCKPGI